jgi:hypothetical protein
MSCLGTNDMCHSQSLPAEWNKSATVAENSDVTESINDVIE